MPQLISIAGAGSCTLKCTKDDNPDVRYALAENYQTSQEVLEYLIMDQNPYVADRAKETLQALMHQHVVSQKNPTEVVRSMPEPPISVLLIEDNAADAKLLQKRLAESSRASFEVHWVTRLTEGLQTLETEQIDVVLLDLALPDSQSLDTFHSIHSRFNQIPIIVLTGLDDETTAFSAIPAGAKDYLVKGQIPGGLLIRAILYAIERNESNERIQRLNAELENRILELAAANSGLEESTRMAAVARDQALQSSNFKSQFVAKMSHEIRTPIAALISIIELLKACKVSDERAELLRMADESAHCLLDVINDVLDLSKIEAGKIELQFSDFSPTTLIEELGDLFVPAAKKKNLKIVTFVDPALPAAVVGDPVRLRQVLLNFAGNAIKFTDHGEVALHAKLVAEGSDSMTVSFSVVDSGCGIPQTEIQKLFQPFVQVDKKTNQGTGLGLSICKRLVELMNGQIGVTSNEGRGSTFWMSVELKRSSTAPGRQYHFEQAQTLLSPDRVMIVSNSRYVGGVCHQYMSAAGLRSSIAANADEGLSLVRQAYQTDDPYRLVLVDLERADALSFAEELNGDPSISATSLVYLTDSMEKDSYDEKAWQAGFNKCLFKPIRQSRLIDCVIGVLGKNRSADAILADATRTTAFQRTPLSGQRSVSVLLAEDNEVLQKLLIAQLSKLGFMVTAVRTGREAITSFENSNYSLVLMDIGMPELNGVEASHAIRRIESSKRRRHTPIIALTAQTMPGDRERCIAAGMDDYLAKPVTLDQLRELLQRWTDVQLAS